MGTNIRLGEAATADVRRRLGVPRSPLTSLSGNLLTHRLRPKTPGLHTPYLYVAGAVPGAPFCLHAEYWGLSSINLLHAGASKHWVVVPPADRDLLESHLRDRFGRCFGRKWTKPRCGQFVRHMDLWVPVATLAAWGVRHQVVKQRAGQIMVTAPWAYHQGWNGGWNVAEAVNFAGAGHGVASDGYCPCFRGCWPNPEEADPNFEALWQPPTRVPPPITLRWVGPGTDAPDEGDDKDGEDGEDQEDGKDELG